MYVYIWLVILFLVIFSKDLCMKCNCGRMRRILKVYECKYVCTDNVCMENHKTVKFENQ